MKDGLLALLLYVFSVCQMLCFLSLSQVHQMQSNGVDCGLWVLATIAASLRGFHVTGLTEEDMCDLRATLLHRLLALPVLS
jgi:Ulp1 family protease